MEYSKTKLRLSGIIVWLSIGIGLIGYWITTYYIFFEVGVVVIGIDFLVFSHDLAMDQVVKFKFNYWFVRIGYLLVGVMAILAIASSWKW